MRSIFPLIGLVLLVACNNDNIVPIAADDGNRSVDDAAALPLSPGTRPVRIGESGASFAACATNGRVVDLTDGATLPVYAAPFENAAVTGRLASGRALFVCTRSMNQRWLGVVIPPAATEGATGGATDCGVAKRVDSPRRYDGACLSGWVANSFVRFTGDAPK